MPRHNVCHSIVINLILHRRASMSIFEERRQRFPFLWELLQFSQIFYSVCHSITRMCHVRRATKYAQLNALLLLFVLSECIEQHRYRRNKHYYEYITTSECFIGYSAIWLVRCGAYETYMFRGRIFNFSALAHSLQ